MWNNTVIPLIYVVGCCLRQDGADVWVFQFCADNGRLANHGSFLKKIKIFAINFYSQKPYT